VAKIGRNEPCPCGSGRKAKRCCGIERGPSEESLARAFLSGAARQGAEWTSHLSDVEFDALLDELWELPACDLALQVEPPKLFPPELDRLCEAVEDDDPDPDLLDDVARWIDAPPERARLARALLAKAEERVIDRELAGAALVDLACDSRIYLRAALLEAVAVRVGATATPAGLRLVA
jgi:SEC-C motif-containing protein